MKNAPTSRGFGRIEFDDAYGHGCSLQQSSAIDMDSEDGLDRPGSSYVWLGLNDANPQVLCSQAESMGLKRERDVGWQPYPIPDDVNLWTRMHLSRDNVRDLIGRLQHWLDTGEVSCPDNGGES